MPEIPISDDHEPRPTDNPRHWVWIDDEQGLRRVTVRNPGEEQINVSGAIYAHTREFRPTGRWVYTKVES